jgi:hypothetical protein
MWKQQLQILQITPFVTHLGQAPHFPEKLPEGISNVHAHNSTYLTVVFN